MNFGLLQWHAVGLIIKLLSPGWAYPTMRIVRRGEEERGGSEEKGKGGEGEMRKSRLLVRVFEDKQWHDPVFVTI